MARDTQLAHAHEIQGRAKRTRPFIGAGFREEQWLELVSVMFTSNIVWNLLFGIFFTVRFG